MTPNERAEFVEVWRQRQALVRTEGDMTRRVDALAKRMAASRQDPLLALAAHPYLAARATLRQSRLDLENRIRQLVRTENAWMWAKNIPGLAELGVGSIIAEAGGDLLAYPSHSKLWRRMGLAVSDDGRAQRRRQGPAGELEGFSPRRRAVSYNVASALFRVQSVRGGSYRSMYDARKSYEEARTSDAKHAHVRSMRYIEKRIVRDLWRAARHNHGGQ